MGVWTCGRVHAGIPRTVYAPLLVTVNEPRRNGANVCAGTDEQEDDE
jgi:hypothetical protein